MAWEADVKALKTPVLIITGDADVATLEHSVAMFRLLGGGVMGDMGKPLPASRLAVLPATSHTAVITQPDLLHCLHRAVPQGRDAEGDSSSRRAGLFRPATVGLDGALAPLKEWRGSAARPGPAADGPADGSCRSTGSNAVPPRALPAAGDRPAARGR